MNIQRGLKVVMVMHLHYSEYRTIIFSTMTDPTVIETESTLTDRYQTTIPAPVRSALGLNKKDKIRYIIHQDGTVTINKNVVEEDPVLVKFLDFLTNDMEANPQNIQALDSKLRERVSDLVAGVEIDLDLPLNDEDE